MKRRSFLQVGGYASILPFTHNNHNNLFRSIWADYKMVPLRNDVGIFLEKGGTIGWLLSNSANIVIDSQFPEQAGHLIEEIKKKTSKKLDLLINTHHHGDHTAGNIAFKGMVDKVVAHENAKANQERVAVERGTEDKQLYADKTFAQTWGGSFGPEIISMSYHGAAHTDGDIITHFENSNVVHMGDLVFNRRFPYIDKGAGASIKNWINVLAKTEDMFDEDTLFIFGHAADGYEVTGTKEDIVAFKDYLSRLLDYMRKMIANGKSKEEITEVTKSIPGADEWTSGGINRSIDAAWEELHEEKE